MRFGLSTIIYNLEFLELTKTKKDLEKLYLSYIDLTRKIALKHGFKVVEVFALFDNAYEILPPIIKQIKDRIGVFDEITFHTPLSFMSIKATQKSIMIGKKLGAKKIIIHPHYSPLAAGSKQSKTKDILELIKFCKKQDLIPCMENLPSESPEFNRPEEFDVLVKKGAYLTVDVGHAVTVNVNPVSFLERFGDKVKHVHLQDNVPGMPDRHLAIGDGELDYMKFMSKLEEMEYDGFVILELLSEEDVIKSLKRLKKFVKF